MKRILFVDDELNVLDGIRRNLRADRHRWQMDFVNDGAAAIEAIKAARFDIIISDMRMPGMNGATLLGHVRDISPQTARLILTGYSEVDLMTKAIPIVHSVLAKPCNEGQIRQAIERVCTMQDLFENPALHRTIGAIGTLPTLSKTYQDLARAIQNPEATVNEVANIVEHDMAMTARILQLINSGFFGLPNRIANIHAAVAFLGLETIKNLALASDAFSVFVPDSRLSQSMCERLQNHSHSAAQIVAKISPIVPLDPATAEIAVISALLQDIGELVLAIRLPEQYTAIHALAREQAIPYFEAEHQVLGTTHAEIGAYLLGLWGLHSSIVEAIANHHQPLRIPHTGFDCATAVYVASLIASDLEADPPNLSPLPHAAADQITLEKLELLKLYPELKARCANPD